MQSRRLSRRRLMVLFAGALILGVVLRLLLLPPTIALTAVESNFLGSWNVVNQTDQTSLLWQFDRERQLTVLKTVDDERHSEIWSGRWQVRDGELQVSSVKNAAENDVPESVNFALQFADTPDELTWKDASGIRFRATKSR